MTPSLPLTQTIAAGLRHQMSLRLMDAANLQRTLGITAKEAHDIYAGRVCMTLNELGDVAEWLEVDPHVFFCAEHGQAPA